MPYVSIRAALLATVLLGTSRHAIGNEATAPLQLFVATVGDDSWSGKISVPNDSKTDGPFASLEAARDAIRELKQAEAFPAGGVEVLIKGGSYFLKQTFVLQQRDCGTATAPVVYSAFQGEEVRLSGGRVVSGFEAVTDADVLDRLVPAARKHVLRTDLNALGITNYGSPKGGGIELFYQDQPMQLSRWPNEGFVKIVEESGGDKFDVRGRRGDRIGKWVYDGDRPIRWLQDKDAWLYGYWFWDWSAQHHKIKSIDTGSRTIEVEKPYHGYGYRKGQWYYALNLLSEIDRPGEWYLDRETGVLYFWPPTPIESKAAIVSMLDCAIRLDGVSHCTLRGLTVEAVRGTAIRVSGGVGNRIVACTIRNSGGSAVGISGGQRHGVVGCDIYEMGGGGISLQGGERKTLTPANHFAVNNHIHHYARWVRMYQAAVSLRGVGHRVEHNLIHNAPHMAISFGGNDHVIEFNEIHSVCYESNDAGAIYAGRNWTERGTMIRHNYFHHINGFEGRGCIGIYLDDMFCGTHVYGNLFYRVTRAAFIGGGRDNTIENNLFVDCPRALHVDNRAQTWASYHVDTTMKERLEEMPYTQPPWRSRFPELLTIMDDEPAAPKGNRIVRNVFLGTNWSDIGGGARPYLIFENNVTEEDPGLATPERIGENLAPLAVDFALRADSPAFEMGFKPLSLEQMGLRVEEPRASWPVAHKVRPAEK